jgi:hypothetical protein
MNERRTERLLRRIAFPIVTILEAQLDEWIAQNVNELAEDIVKRTGQELRNIERIRSIRYRVEEEVDRIARYMVKDLDRKIVSRKYVALAEGDLVEDEEKYCVIVELPDLLESVAETIYEMALDKIYSRNWVEETAKTVKKKKIKLEPVYSPWGELTDLERNLLGCIPVIYEDEIRDFIEGLSEELAQTVTRGEGVDEYDAYYEIRDAVRENIDEIDKELDKWGSDYVNIVRGSFSTRERTTCKIISVSNFYRRLDRIIINRALKLAGLANERFNYEPIAENYFDEELYI